MHSLLITVLLLLIGCCADICAQQTLLAKEPTSVSKPVLVQVPVAPAVVSGKLVGNPVLVAVDKPQRGTWSRKMEAFGLFATPLCMAALFGTGAYYAATKLVKIESLIEQLNIIMVGSILGGCAGILINRLGEANSFWENLERIITGAIGAASLPIICYVLQRILIHTAAPKTEYGEDEGSDEL